MNAKTWFVERGEDNSVWVHIYTGSAGTDHDAHIVFSSEDWNKFIQQAFVV